MADFVVLGAGGWGMALAIAAHHKGHRVAIWSPFEQEVALLSQTRENARLLKGVRLPEDIHVTSDLSPASEADFVVLATPSTAVRETAVRLKAVRPKGIVVSVSKGLEAGTLLRLSEVIASELPEVRVAVLSGPSHAEEVARFLPTSLVAAAPTAETAVQVQQAFTSDELRVYTNDDLIGVELGGALKNVIAIAAGFCEGISLGDNTKAALITRGLTEIARLGVAEGAKERTFAGLTGLGDLIVTCTSKHSRNNRFGNLVGKGTPVAEALRIVGTVEGYYATDMAHGLAQKCGVEMPILEQCYQVLYADQTVEKALKALMQRPTKNEHESCWLA